MSIFSVPIDEVWVVYASSGRCNGCAYVRAKTAEQAEEFAQTCGWLNNGRVEVGSTESAAQWILDMEGGPIDSDDVRESADFDKINSLTEEGNYVEIMWGT